MSLTENPQFCYITLLKAWEAALAMNKLLLFRVTNGILLWRKMQRQLRAACNAYQFVIGS